MAFITFDIVHTSFLSPCAPTGDKASLVVGSVPPVVQNAGIPKTENREGELFDGLIETISMGRHSLRPNILNPLKKCT